MSTYLTYDERLEIKAGLKERLSFGAIGKNSEKTERQLPRKSKNTHTKKSGYPG